MGQVIISPEESRKARSLGFVLSVLSPTTYNYTLLLLLRQKILSNTLVYPHGIYPRSLMERKEGRKGMMGFRKVLGKEGDGKV